jgi:hypothetical protein
MIGATHHEVVAWPTVEGVLVAETAYLVGALLTGQIV